MQEITDKLAHELIERLNKLERFCDEKAKEGRPRKYDVDTGWMTAGCMCFDLRTHIYHHMQDMIKHPGYQADPLIPPRSDCNTPTLGS
jgi:hypothetical protein